MCIRDSRFTAVFSERESADFNSMFDGIRAKRLRHALHALRCFLYLQLRCVLCASLPRWATFSTFYASFSSFLTNKDDNNDDDDDETAH